MSPLTTQLPTTEWMDAMSVPFIPVSMHTICPHLYSVICLTNLRTRSSMPCVPATLPPLTMTVVGLGCSTVEGVVVALEAAFTRTEPWVARQGPGTDVALLRMLAIKGEG